jgi:hypothetical protein
VRALRGSISRDPSLFALYASRAAFSFSQAKS